MGQSLNAAASRDGQAGATPADEVSRASPRRPRNATPRPGGRSAGSDAGGDPRGAPDLGQHLGDLAGVGSLGDHGQKKRFTPTNNGAPTSPLSGVDGATGSRCGICASTSFLMNVA